MPQTHEDYVWVVTQFLDTREMLDEIDIEFRGPIVESLLWDLMRRHENARKSFRETHDLLLNVVNREGNFIYHGSGFKFRLADWEYVYDRFGLRRKF